MEERISDYCNNCKRRLDLSCEGKSVSCYEYYPIIPNKYGRKKK